MNRWPWGRPPCSPGRWCCSELTPFWVIAAGPSCLAQLPPLGRMRAGSPSSWEPGHCEVHGPTSPPPPPLPHAIFLSQVTPNSRLSSFTEAQNLPVCNHNFSTAVKPPKPRATDGDEDGGGGDSGVCDPQPPSPHAHTRCSRTSGGVLGGLSIQVSEISEPKGPRLKSPLVQPPQWTLTHTRMTGLALGAPSLCHIEPSWPGSK